MRSIDGQSGAERPWQHVSNSGQYSPDGFCTSIVSRRHPDVYVREGTNPGFIYSSSISDLISCSYIQDAGSSGWCQELDCKDAHSGAQWTKCTFHGPSGLRDMMAAQDASRGMYYHGDMAHWGYNEVVINAAALQGRLPSAIEGFFIPIEAEPVAYNRAREIHAAFALEYGVSAHDVPLLTYDAGPLGEADPEPREAFACLVCA